MKNLEYFLNNLKSNNFSKRTIDDYKKNIVRFANYSNINDFKEVTTDLIEEYSMYLFGKELSVATIKAYTIPINKYIKFLVSKNVLSENPFKLEIKNKNNKEPNWLTQEQAIQFLRILKKPKDKALYFLALETGLRFSEIASLKVNDILVDDNTYYTQVLGKGGKYRLVGFSQATYNFIQEYVAKDGKSNNDTLFTSSNGKRLDNANLNQSLKKLIKKIGYEDWKSFHFHELRHSFATMQLENGVNIKELQMQLGHANASTTLNTYVHVNKKEMLTNMSKKGIGNLI